MNVLSFIGDKKTFYLLYLMVSTNILRRFSLQIDCRIEWLIVGEFSNPPHDEIGDIVPALGKLLRNGQLHKFPPVHSQKIAATEIASETVNTACEYKDCCYWF